MLVNRMHINPVAFALTYHSFTTLPCSDAMIADPINFAFEKLGFSCGEKILGFDHQSVSKVERAVGQLEIMVAFYSVLATRMAANYSFFAGAIELVKELHNKGMLNFISSAVEQSVLDVIDFAYCLHKEHVLEALDLGLSLLKSKLPWPIMPINLLHDQVSVPPRSIILPSAEYLPASILPGGADFVVSGRSEAIMSSLQALLKDIL